MSRDSATGSSRVVSARDVRKRFGRLDVLKGVSLEVRRGETVCLIGPSGSGKTTFIRCLNHLEKIDGGRIEVNGRLMGYREQNGRLVEDSERSIAKQRTQVGMVFQRFNLFPHKTALENITEAPIRVLGTPSAQAAAEAEALLARVGLADKRNTYPGKLSGGQQQRVAIARARCATSSTSTSGSILVPPAETGNNSWSMTTKASSPQPSAVRSITRMPQTPVLVTRFLLTGSWRGRASSAARKARGRSAPGDPPRRSGRRPSSRCGPLRPWRSPSRA